MNPSEPEPLLSESDAVRVQEQAGGVAGSAPVTTALPEEPAQPAGPSQVKGYNIRGVAFILDLVVIYVGMETIVSVLLIVLMLGLASAASGGPALELKAPGTVPSLIAALVASVLYFVLFEWLFGATPAKAILGLRVVHQDGLPCTLKAALVRELYRFVDGPFIVLRTWASMGLVLPIRFGDRQAKTVVVGRTDPFIRQRRSIWRFVAALAAYLAVVGVIAVILLAAESRALQGGDAHVWRGFLAQARGEYELAAEQFELGLEGGISRYKPEEVYAMLGMARGKLGRYEDAIAAERQAIKLDPNYAVAWHSLGAVYQEMGDLGSAEECYQNALALQPDLAVAALGIGTVRLKRGDVEGAIEAFERARSIDPMRGKADAWLAFAYATAGRFDAADDALREAKKHGYLEWADLQKQIEELRAGQSGDGKE